MLWLSLLRVGGVFRLELWPLSCSMKCLKKALADWNSIIYGYIKNLDKSMDNSGLHDLFQKSGNVLYCKVAMLEDGKKLSKYGKIASLVIAKETMGLPNVLT